MDQLKEVTIFTDGACCPNPGPGGYGVVLLHGRHRKELGGGFRLTTNNRMELLAAIVGLQALKHPCSVTLWTDSRYLADGMMQGWARRWQANGWRKQKPREPVCNADLWQRLLDAAAVHEVRFEWVRGHAGNVENERCNELAEAACLGENLPIDEGYERNESAVLLSPLFDMPTEPPVLLTTAQSCLQCGQPIPPERLEAVPDATRCVTCQGQADAGPIDFRPSGLACPRCAARGIRAQLVWRTPRDPNLPPYFLGCNRFPACRYVDRE